MAGGTGIGRGGDAVGQCEQLSAGGGLQWRPVVQTDLTYSPTAAADRLELATPALHVRIDQMLVHAVEKVASCRPGGRDHAGEDAQVDEVARRRRLASDAHRGGRTICLKKIEKARLEAEHDLPIKMSRKPCVRHRLVESVAAGVGLSPAEGRN